MDSYDPDGFAQAAPASVADADASKRTRKRDSLFLTAQLRIGDDPTTTEVRVRNLSEGGLMVEYPKLVDTGTDVTLDVRGIGEVGGKVAWCAEKRLGIALDSPIDPKMARKPVGVAPKAPFYVKPVPRR